MSSLAIASDRSVGGKITRSGFETRISRPPVSTIVSLRAAMVWEFYGTGVGRTSPGRLFSPGSGPGLGRDVVGLDLLAAVPAGEARVGDLPARVVSQDDRRALGSGHVLVAPSHQRHDCGEQIAPGVRQSVLVAVRIAGIRDSLEQAGVDERTQP